MQKTIEHLNWRYATKKYDPTKKLTEEQRSLIMDALRLAPSSFGLQPWKFIHVTSPEIREKLRAAAYGQSQVTDASDLFVLSSLTKIDEAHIDAYLSNIAETRGMPVEALGEFRKMLVGSVQNRSEEAVTEWSARQVYIALGVALAVAAENEIDASPMEGFDPKQFDEILGLGALGLQSRVILAVGFRSGEDASQHEKKARFSTENVFIQK